MGNAIRQIRAHILDMLGSTRRLLAAIEPQAECTELKNSPQAQWLLEAIVGMLNAHAGDLAEHLQRLGGGGSQAAHYGPVPAPVPFSLERVMMDGYSKLSLAQAAAMMLETNARALGFSSTAALAARHREEIGTILVRIRELLPLAA